MKKALFISSRPIYPIICGGQIRTEQQLEFLSRKFDVDVVFISDIKDPETDKYYRYAKSVIYFYRSKLTCLLGTMKFVFNSLPLQVNYFKDSKLLSYVNDVAVEYDVIFCNNIRTAEYARLVKGPKKIIDFVDAISMNYDKARKHTRGLKRIIYNLDYRRCRRYEHIILSEFDACAIISEIDKQYIEYGPNNSSK